MSWALAGIGGLLVGGLLALCWVRRPRGFIIVIARAHSGAHIAQVLGSDQWWPGETPSEAVANAARNHPEVAGIVRALDSMPVGSSKKSAVK